MMVIISRIFCEAERFTVRTRARAVEVFTTLTSMICTMGEVNKSLQKSLLNPVLATFSEALVAAIAAPDSHTSDAGLKTEVLKALTVLVKNVPKQMANWLPQILPPVWGILTASAEKYVREVVNEGGEDDEVVDSDGEVLGFENLVFAIFEFVHALVETNKFKSAVKAGLSELMYYIVIYMQVIVILMLFILKMTCLMSLFRLRKSNVRSGVRILTVLLRMKMKTHLLTVSEYLLKIFCWHCVKNLSWSAVQAWLR